LKKVFYEELEVFKPSKSICLLPQLSTGDTSKPASEGGLEIWVPITKE
jgi:hypothetical protein